MKKRARTLIVLGVVLLLCVGGYIGVSIYGADNAKKESDQTGASQIYTAAGLGSPVKISYTANNQTLSFDLTGDKWTVTDNKDFPLRQSDLTSLAASLNSLAAVRSFDNPGTISQYGLDKPAYTLKAADSAGKTLTLLIGAQNGDNYYAMTDSGGKIYTIPSTFIGELKTSLLDMITLDTLPSLSEKTINTITLKSGAASLVLDKHTNKDNTTTWFIVRGSTYTSEDEFVLSKPSDLSPQKYVNDAVSALGSASFASCAAYKPSNSDLKTFGLDSPKLTVTVNYTATDSNSGTTNGTAVFDVGAKLEDGSGYYARIPGSQQVNVLPDTAVSPLINALSAMGTAS